jgi:hypothetical protein
VKRGRGRFSITFNVSECRMGAGIGPHKTRSASLTAEWILLAEGGLWGGVRACMEIYLIDQDAAGTWGLAKSDETSGSLWLGRVARPGPTDERSGSKRAWPCGSGRSRKGRKVDGMRWVSIWGKGHDGSHSSSPVRLGMGKNGWT